MSSNSLEVKRDSNTNAMDTSDSKDAKMPASLPAPNSRQVLATVDTSVYNHPVHPNLLTIEEQKDTIAIAESERKSVEDECAQETKLVRQEHKVFIREAMLNWKRKREDAKDAENVVLFKHAPKRQKLDLDITAAKAIIAEMERTPACILNGTGTTTPINLPRELRRDLCTVCQEELRTGTKISILPCGCMFHLPCITGAVLGSAKNECPNDRQVISAAAWQKWLTETRAKLTADAANARFTALQNIIAAQQLEIAQLRTGTQSPATALANNLSNLSVSSSSNSNSSA
jgi:hypothetical protein